MRILAAVALTALVVGACSPADAENATTSSVVSTAATGAPLTTTPPTTGITEAPAPTTTTTPTSTTTTLDEPAEVEGVVIAVEGGLQVIDSFTVLVGDGEQMTFDPAPGLLFGGGPLSHLRDHLADGAPVHVVYTVEPDGTNIAIEVGDAR